ncbi:MAG: hypothetical protein U1F36_17295 [Planctomycetota bacterium]
MRDLEAAQHGLDLGIDEVRAVVGLEDQRRAVRAKERLELCGHRCTSTGQTAGVQRAFAGQVADQQEVRRASPAQAGEVHGPNRAWARPAQTRQAPSPSGRTSPAEAQQDALEGAPRDGGEERFERDHRDATEGRADRAQHLAQSTARQFLGRPSTPSRAQRGNLFTGRPPP